MHCFQFIACAFFLAGAGCATSQKIETKMFDANIPTTAEFAELTPEQQKMAVKNLPAGVTPTWPIGGWETVSRNLVMPGYPRGVRVQGTVNFELYLDSKGNVRRVVINQGVEPAMDRAVTSALFATQFTPARRNGQPVGIHIGGSIYIDSYDKESNHSPEATPGAVH